MSSNYSSSKPAISSPKAHRILSSTKSILSLINLNEYGVDQEAKEDCNEMTKYTLDICDQHPDFTFHTVQIYARPTQKTESEDYKKDAQRAADGWDHIVIILSSGPHPQQYLLDRVEGVRFVVANMCEDELISGHLKLIIEFADIAMWYTNLRSFIKKQSQLSYNVIKNNCIKFAYDFIVNILKVNQWKNLKTFWKFVSGTFNKKDIEAGKYNEQQNDFVKLKAQTYITLINDKHIRKSWKKGDQVLVKSANFKGRKQWYMGIIKTINLSDDSIHVEYKKMGTMFYKTTYVRNCRIKPFINIPSGFLDPITNKIMRNPVQILKSGVIYDEITVKYIQTTQLLQGDRRIDPVTGVLISIGRNKKIIVMNQQSLRKKINNFLSNARKHHYQIEPELKNNFDAVNNPQLWETQRQRVRDKYDIIKQQAKIDGKSILVFYDVDETFDEKFDEKKSEKKEDENKYMLKWNEENMFVNHTSIPIITCMGPSRVGKSFLLNQIVRNQPKFRNTKFKKNVFEISRSANVAQTKGAWITLYDETEKSQGREYKNDSNDLLIDQWPEDDVEMWTNYDVQQWFYSLNRNFKKKYQKLIKYMCDNEINGQRLVELRNKRKLNALGVNDNDALCILNILEKRLKNRMDEINSDNLKQLYLVDMEGLSHGVTDFTCKLFNGCYAISNVVIWYDSEVASGRFVSFMNELKDKMAIIANSNHKPAFIYILRNYENIDFDFCDKNSDEDSYEDSDEYSDEYSDEEKEGDDDIDAFDTYIKTHKTFEWFRNMNIFSSYHGYQLESPENLTNKTKNTRRAKKLYYKPQTLNALISKIKSISNNTMRFAGSEIILNSQLSSINSDLSLSLEKRIAICNVNLRLFMLDKKEKKRKLQKENAVIACNYKKEIANEYFNRGYKSLKKQLKLKDLNISKTFDDELQKNRTEICSNIGWYNSLMGKAYKKLVKAGQSVKTGIFYLVGEYFVTNSNNSYKMDNECMELVLSNFALHQIKETDLESLQYYS